MIILIDFGIENPPEKINIKKIFYGFITTLMIHRLIRTLLISNELVSDLIFYYDMIRQYIE